MNSRPRSRAWCILITVGVAALLIGLVVFFGLGRWLVVEDPLVKASAIMVLSGAMPLRAIEAAKLYREEYAPEIHTRRVGLLWRRLASGQGRAIVRAARDDPFDPRHWWRSTSDALDVVREALGLLNVWAGLPLHQAR